MAPISPAPSSESTIYVPGDVVAGKYQLESMLGEGGMGTVWRARNTALDAPVAIKVIRADLNREALGTRLLQEARAAARLGHPAIVRVFDVGQTERGDPFIVMELLEGQSFGALLAEGRLPSAQAVQILLPIADALSRAHAKGIVHRDLKPDNVFIVKDEERIQPKLVDFGIVKIDQHNEGSHLTQVGTVLGSPEYMSPEQARGQDDVDHRTDVWSFAVMLYEATTGGLPFAAANYNALMRLIVEYTPPTAVELAAGDAQLSAIIEQGMSKDRDQRYKSMGEFGRALAQWLVAQGYAEDACGVSLESKWLGRSSDPAQARSSMVSAPDLLPPHSGVRGRTPGGLPVAATELARPAAPASSPPKPADRTWIWIGVAGAMAVVITVIFAMTGSSSDSPGPVPATAVSPKPKPKAEIRAERKALEAPKLEPSAPAPAPAAVSAQAQPAKAAPKPVQAGQKKASAKKPVPPAVSASKPAAPKKLPPGHDLLSPY